jgi:hypothetical protein
VVLSDSIMKQLETALAPEKVAGERYNEERAKLVDR